MANIFSRKYQPHRIGAIIAVGLTTILVVRARNTIIQEPKVQVSPAPELSGGPWLNTPSPIKLSSRKGKVTMVEFWTFQCSNCRANLDTYERWQKKYSPSGFTILAIHTPELPDEYKPELVKDFIAKKGITYPVLLDNDYANWSRWKQEYWPAIYLLDKSGNIREKWLGELGSDGTAKVEAKIEALLKE